MTKQIDRIAAVFAHVAASNRSAALIPYITAGDPAPAITVPLMHALVAAGADIIELGVPFSDPVADGPVIQRAAARAIAQGVGLSRVLELVAEFRCQNSATPVVLMGYANPIERMGQEAFARAAQAAGMDGLIVVDYPPEESMGFVKILEKHAIAPIFLLAPTSTEERIQAIGQLARGYVYYVSLKGVTGSASLDAAEVAQRLQAIRRHVRLPIGVGFGIRDAANAQRVARIADAVVIGSKLVETMEAAVAASCLPEKETAAITAAHDWLHSIRQALDETE